MDGVSTRAKSSPGKVGVMQVGTDAAAILNKEAVVTPLMLGQHAHWRLRSSKRTATPHPLRFPGKELLRQFGDEYQSHSLSRTKVRN